MFDGENLRNRATSRVADDVRSFQLQRVHQFDDIGGHAIDGVGDARMIALPDPAVIMHDHLEAFSEDGNLLAPKGAIATQTGEKEDGKPRSMPLVVKLTIADRNARHAVRIRSNRDAGR